MIDDFGTKKMKHFQKIFLILVVAVIGFGCGQQSGNYEKRNFGGGKGTFDKPEKPKFKIPVTVERVKRGRMYAYLQEVGTIVPIKEIEIKPEMTGRIYYTKKWMEGDEVEEGSLFANMDDRELKLNINEAELQLEIAKASVRPASANLAQAIKDEEFKAAMYKRGAISKAEYDQAVLLRIQRENAYQQALKEIEAREMALKKMKQELEKVPIVIPFDGVLLPAKQSLVNTQKEGGETDLTLMNGLMVGSSSVLCRLADIEQVYLALDVPAKDLVEVEIGQEVEIDAFSRSGRNYRGVVKEISTALNANTRTYTVNVLINNPEHELRPGMFAKARIITEEKLDTISIPRDLLILQNNQDVVFVAKEKPSDQIKNATGEQQFKPISDQKEPSVAQSGSFEKIAVASEDVQSPTPEENLEAFADSEAEISKRPPMIAEKRVVTTGIENRKYIEIIDGLKEGELLVVLGYETLTDGVDISVNIREDEFLREDNSFSN